jgi:cephalosporin-C deacetylase-like acetyl esterase
MVPADLEAFWQRTIEALQHTPLKATLTEAPEHSGREYVTSLVQMDSFAGKRLRAWYAVPRDPVSGGKFPAVLAVPGYGGDKPIPTHLVMSGFAVLTLYPRGQGESRREWELEHSTKLTYHVTDKERFYYRGAYMDCVRGVDFLASRPEVDAARLGMWSRSQGGGLTLATAALDHRLRVAVAEEPFLCNYPVAITLTSRPYGELHDYAAAHPELRPAILDTLAYFDPLHLAPFIQCPTLVNIGMRDAVCPASTILPVFERITAPKALHVYPDLTHAPCTDFNAHAMHWLRRYLGA